MDFDDIRQQIITNICMARQLVAQLSAMLKQ